MVHCTKIRLTFAVQHEIWESDAVAAIVRDASSLSDEPLSRPCSALWRHPMATSPEAVKTTMENMTTAGNKAFKDSVEKSMAALAEMNTHSKKNLEAVVASVTAATKGAETLGARAMAYSKKSLQDHVAAAKSLTAAKSVQEAIELQTNFAKSAFEAYVAEVTKMSETVAASMKETVAPINERMTAVVERAQSAH
jgi:phasin family protein